MTFHFSDFDKDSSDDDNLIDSSEESVGEQVMSENGEQSNETESLPKFLPEIISIYMFIF